MKPHVHRTPEMKARRVAAMVKSPAELRELLRQFSPDHHAGLIERLKPHLDFEPEALPSRELPDDGASELAEDTVKRDIDGL